MQHRAKRPILTFPVICALNPLNLCQNRPLPASTVPARASPRQERVGVAMADGVTHGTPPGVFAMRHPAIAPTFSKPVPVLFLPEGTITPAW